MLPTELIPEETLPAAAFPRRFMPRYQVRRSHPRDGAILWLVRRTSLQTPTPLPPYRGYPCSTHDAALVDIYSLQT